MKIRYSIKQAVFSSLFLGSLLIFFAARVTAQTSSVVINEIHYFQDQNTADINKTHEWIELYNKGSQGVSLKNWTISNRSGNSLTTLPDIILPPNSYLVVHFQQGANDYNFTDKEGDFYTGHNAAQVDFFAESMDEVALYNSFPFYFSIVDFVAWKASDDPFRGGTAHFYARVARIWDNLDFIDATDVSNQIDEKIQSVEQGTSIGRDKNATDTNQSNDWGASGGIDAIEMTIGFQNLSVFELIVGPPKTPLPKKEWTFLVYLDGDNDLWRQAGKELQELEVAGSDANVNVVFQVDWANSGNVKVSRDGARTFRPTESTWRGYLEKESVPNSKRVYFRSPPGSNPDLGELNMGDPKTLSDFISWGKTCFPAEKYAVIVWDHGLGWKGSTYDETSKDYLEIGELDKIIPGKVDLIGFDQCFMGMTEVAYQLNNMADVFVASEEKEYIDGWPYTTIVNGLKGNPKITANQLGIQIVDHFHNYYSRIVPRDFHTLSAVDLGGVFNNFVQDVSNFGLELTTGIEDYGFLFVPNYIDKDNVQLKIRTELFASEHFQDKNFIDLSDFAFRIQKNVGIPLAYKTNADIIQTKLRIGNGIIIAEAHGNAHPNAHGLSIYFPAYQTKDGLRGKPLDTPVGNHSVLKNKRYAPDPNDCLPPPVPQHHPILPTPNFLFVEDTKWDELIHRYHEPVADAGADLTVRVNEIFELNGSGSSDSDGFITKWAWDIDSTSNTDREDIDKDCRDENNDDSNLSGEKVKHSYSQAGTYVVTLTVWDDHHHQNGHKDHIETDQDEVVITVLPPDVPIIDLEMVTILLEETDQDIYSVTPVGYIQYSGTMPKTVTVRLYINGTLLHADKTYTLTGGEVCLEDEFCNSYCLLTLAGENTELLVEGQCNFNQRCLCKSIVPVNLPPFEQVYLSPGTEIRLEFDPTDLVEELDENNNVARLTIEEEEETENCNGCQNALVCDDFEDYELEQGITSSDYWRLWSDESLDGIVSAEISSEGRQSLYMVRNLESEEQQSDVVLKLGDKTSGKYRLAWDMLVLSGKQGYFNFQKYQNPTRPEFGFEVFFFENGIARIVTGGGTGEFRFPQNTWMNIQFYFDLDNNIIRFYLNDTWLYYWPLNNQARTTNGIKQVGGINFYAGEISENLETYVEYYIDRVCFQSVEQLPMQRRSEQVAETLTPALAKEELNILTKQNEVSNSKILMNIFPNPSSGIIHINTDLPQTDDATLTLINPLGEKILHLNFREVTIIREQLDLSYLPEGIYYLQLKTNLEERVQKIVLAR